MSSLPPVARQFLGYLLVGVGTTALYYGIWAALFGMGIDYRVASGIGYGLGSLVNYGIRKAWTFADKTRGAAAGAQLVVYWLVVGVSLGLTVVLVWAGVSALGLIEAVSVALASGIVLVFNFASHRWITFNPALWARPQEGGAS
jgi:putative flippase GtrA